MINYKYSYTKIAKNKYRVLTEKGILLGHISITEENKNIKYVLTRINNRYKKIIIEGEFSSFIQAIKIAESCL